MLAVPFCLPQKHPIVLWDHSILAFFLSRPRSHGAVRGEGY